MKLLVEESEFIYCDVQDILRYLRRRNPVAAVRFLEAFKSTVDLLSRMPHLGRLRPDSIAATAFPGA
jgi:plasmid stabilization system protein ParE